MHTYRLLHLCSTALLKPIMYAMAEDIVYAPHNP